MCVYIYICYIYIYINTLILENPMDRRAWQATIHGVARIRHDLATKPPPPPYRHTLK